MIKNLLAMQETQVQSLGQEDPLDEGMANPLQYSCLENSMDGGAWQAIVHAVTKSQTQLKQLSTREYKCGVDQEKQSNPKVPKGQVEFRKIKNGFE